MPVENVPFFTIQDTPLTNVTPFTFRDGITYVEKLERVAKNCQNLVDAINKCVKICNELEANVNKTVAQLRAETDRKIQYAIDELYRKLAARGGEKVFVTDPSTGSPPRHSRRRSPACTATSVLPRDSLSRPTISAPPPSSSMKSAGRRAGGTWTPRPRRLTQYERISK